MQIKRSLLALFLIVLAAGCGPESTSNSNRVVTNDTEMAIRLEADILKLRLFTPKKINAGINNVQIYQVESDKPVKPGEGTLFLERYPVKDHNISADTETDLAFDFGSAHGGKYYYAVVFYVTYDENGNKVGQMTLDSAKSLTYALSAKELKAKIPENALITVTHTYENDLMKPWSEVIDVKFLLEPKVSSYWVPGNLATVLSPLFRIDNKDLFSAIVAPLANPLLNEKCGNRERNELAIAEGMDSYYYSWGVWGISSTCIWESVALIDHIDIVNMSGDELEYKQTITREPNSSKSSFIPRTMDTNLDPNTTGERYMYAVVTGRVVRGYNPDGKPIEMPFQVRTAEVKPTWNFNLPKPTPTDDIQK